MIPSSITLNYCYPKSPDQITSLDQLNENRPENNIDALVKNQLKVTAVDADQSFLQVIREQLTQYKNQIVGVVINGVVCDLSSTLESALESGEANFKLISIYEPAGLEILRHTTTHVMAYAIENLNPEILITIGPVIDSGFFYDLDQVQLKEEDFPKIEEEMGKIIKNDHPSERIEMSRDEALEFFKDNPYKVEVISEIPTDDIITCYRMGEFTDLCRGPHLPSTGLIKAYKLLKLAGAYWRGISENKMLVRVYGTSFPNQKLLKNHLSRLEKAKERDHNKLGREMDIFTSNELIGQGLPLLTPKGTTLKLTLQRFVEDEERKRGYEFTQTPYMAKSDLFKVSGHWQHYQDSMFVINNEDETFALRPMTCPFHFCLYNAKRRSYRELPVRLAETSVLFRNEASGEMHGLIRVRQFTLSDGHIVCREDQIAQEFQDCLELSEYYLKTLNLKNYWFRLSKWNPEDKEKYVDNPEAWNSTQNKMKQILDNLKVNYVESVGDAAFYGPKLDLQMRNVYGKEDTLMTIQIDFAQAEKFDMKYIDENDQEQTPFVIHRGSLGCYERTIALLIEEYEGKFPFWLAPEQVIVLSINEDSHDYARQVHEKLMDNNIRSNLDLRSESLKKKVRDAQLSKTPCIVSLGGREKEENTVSVRTLSGKVVMGIPLDNFLTKCNAMNQNRQFENTFDKE